MNKNKVYQLENPWSGVVAKEMTWDEITEWCKENVHPDNRREWMKAAREAAKNNDSATLGRMIIGS